MLKNKKIENPIVKKSLKASTTTEFLKNSIKIPFLRSITVIAEKYRCPV